MRGSVAILLSGALLACGATTPDDDASKNTWTASPTGQQGVTSGSELERYFPLVDGNVYQYVTEGETGEQGMLVARVHRADAARGELRFPSGAKRFEYVSDGLKISTGMGQAYVLKTPIAVGTSWTGEHGGQTRIISVNAIIDVKAGHFTGCVQTLEERRGDRPVKYATTFCPGTGIVLLEAASGAALERAELSSYGAPVKLGPDGVFKTQTTPPPQ